MQIEGVFEGTFSRVFFLDAVGLAFGNNQCPNNVVWCIKITPGAGVNQDWVRLDQYTTYLPNGAPICDLQLILILKTESYYCKIAY